MRVFICLLLCVGTLVFSCSESKTDNTDNAASPMDQPDTNSVNNDLPAEFPGIDFPGLLDMNAEELRIARNSIFAKHVRSFDSEDLNDHFNSQPWYATNEHFSKDLLSESDKTIIELITHLEKNKNILWKSISNIDGAGNEELCLLVEKSDHSGALMYINDERIEITNNWSEEEETFYGESLSSSWSNLEAKIIDIDTRDNQKEVLVRQKYFEWVDPGFENVIITKFDDTVKSFTLGSNSYDSGVLTFSNNNFIMNVSNCPDHTQTYAVENGEIVMVSESIGEEPEYGCPACFVGESLVTMANGQQKQISELKVGDKILSYDTRTGVKSETIVEEIVAVYHRSLIELIFQHDTIISTKDHPYYVNHKGWSSFNAAATLAHYSNYTAVNTIQRGDGFIRSDGSITELLAFHPSESGQMTYTITKLKNGDAFYVNDILVGVEVIGEGF